jgi:hypothetical protein
VYRDIDNGIDLKQEHQGMSGGAWNVDAAFIAREQQKDAKLRDSDSETVKIDSLQNYRIMSGHQTQTQYQ